MSPSTSSHLSNQSGYQHESPTETQTEYESENQSGNDSECGEESIYVGIDDIIASESSLEEIFNKRNKLQVLVKEAWVPAPGSVVGEQYLDFVQVITEGLSFDAIELHDRARLAFYPWQSAKHFPSKLFTDFETNGHSFYIGKLNSDIDVYILTKPSEYEVCGCSKDRYIGMDKYIATMILNEVIIKSLNSVPKRDIIGHNIVVTDDFENFTEFQVTEFYMNVLLENANRPNAPSFIQTFKSSWQALNQVAFFRDHQPQLVFLKYGQNMKISNHEHIAGILGRDFAMTRVRNLKISIATNLTWHPLLSDGGQPHQREPCQYIGDILQGPPPGLCSLNLGQDGVKKLFQDFSAKKVTIYGKAFHPAFSNFQSAEVPQTIKDLLPEGSHYTVSSPQGYSTVSHGIRRTSKMEPFAGRPVANFLKAKTPGMKATWRGKIAEDQARLVGLIGQLETVASDYRIEVTLEW